MLEEDFFFFSTDTISCLTQITKISFSPGKKSIQALIKCMNDSIPECNLMDCLWTTSGTHYCISQDFGKKLIGYSNNKLKD